MNCEQIKNNADTHLVIVGICLLVILFSTPAFETLVNLKHISLNAFKNYSLIFSRLYKPGSGIEVLPSRVKSALYLLYSNEINEYKLSDKLRKDPLIRQRITESAWPKRRVKNASYTLLLISEITENTSVIEIERRKDIALVNNAAI